MEATRGNSEQAYEWSECLSKARKESLSSTFEPHTLADQGHPWFLKARKNPLQNPQTKQGDPQEDP
jgi:hypothetical protein